MDLLQKLVQFKYIVKGSSMCTCVGSFMLTVWL